MSIFKNSDIIVPPEFLDSFEVIRPLLAHEPSAKSFIDHDRRATRYRRLYRGLGSSSLSFGALAMGFGVVDTTRKAMGNAGADKATSLTFGVLGLVSLLLLSAMWAFDLRNRWLRAVFVRERIRQWRHNVLLHSQLLDDLGRNQATGTHRLNGLWGEFSVELATADGSALSFVAAAVPRLGSEGMPASRQAVEEAKRAYLELRLRYQLRYAETRTTPAARRFSLPELEATTSWMAATSVVAAVVLSVVSPFVEVRASTSSTAPVLLSGVAIGLAVFSTAVRVFRTAMGLPALLGSFELYRDELRSISVAAEKSADDEAIFRAFREVEARAASELGRFLEINLASRFAL